MISFTLGLFITFIIGLIGMFKGFFGGICKIFKKKGENEPK